MIDFDFKKDVSNKYKEVFLYRTRGSLEVCYRCCRNQNKHEWDVLIDYDIKTKTKMETIR
jgi:hypothetical protein